MKDLARCSLSRHQLVSKKVSHESSVKQKTSNGTILDQGYFLTFEANSSRKSTCHLRPTVYPHDTDNQKLQDTREPSGEVVVCNIKIEDTFKLARQQQGINEYMDPSQVSDSSKKPLSSLKLQSNDIMTYESDILGQQPISFRLTTEFSAVCDEDNINQDANPNLKSIVKSKPSTYQEYFSNQSAQAAYLDNQPKTRN